ncbi:MAG: ribonuclease [Actinomycetia bacterium]|nr:ribonuclease [Actinomycetes bacterium]
MSRLHLPAEVVPSWADLRTELGVVEAFPAEAQAEAVVAAPPPPALDRTDVELFTVDPPGSRDLDQAMWLGRQDDGWRVVYAIADVGAFVRPGGALDAESRRRGETLYAPDTRVPMLPPELSEGRASLLPGEHRPAVLWTLDLDRAGSLVGTDVRRALVRSRRQLDYQQAMAEPELRQVGELLMADARARGALSLPTPEQEVLLEGDRPTLRFRVPLASERWNEQISLLTGRAAAALMLAGKVGLLRTLPPPAPADVASLRRSALALGLEWPEGRSYGEVLSDLDPADGRAAAVLDLAPRLLRGAGYTAFDGNVPDQVLHSAVGAAYAHCTAPLRRLADRFVSEVCLALAAGEPVPDWARTALPALPELMAGADHRAHALERAGLDLAEAIVLRPSVGQEFRATVVDAEAGKGTVQLADPAVRAPVRGVHLPVGETVTVRLVEADPSARKVRFETV